MGFKHQLLILLGAYSKTITAIYCVLWTRYLISNNINGFYPVCMFAISLGVLIAILNYCDVAYMHYATTKNLTLEQAKEVIKILTGDKNAKT